MSVETNRNKNRSFVKEYRQVRTLLRVFLLDGNKTADFFTSFGIGKSTYDQIKAKLLPYIQQYIDDDSIPRTRKIRKHAPSLPTNMFDFEYNYLCNTYTMCGSFLSRKIGRMIFALQYLNSQKRPLSCSEILNRFEQIPADPDKDNPPDQKKSFDATLSELCNYGLINKKGTRYSLRKNPLENIESAENCIALLDLISLGRNLLPPYLCGNMLLETAYNFFREKQIISDYKSPFIIKGSYFNQVLDDEILWDLIEIMRESKEAMIYYADEQPFTVAPLKIITDKSSGRRYLFGQCEERFRMLRLDKINQVELTNRTFDRSKLEGKYSELTLHSFRGITLPKDKLCDITLKFTEAIPENIYELFPDCTVSEEQLTVCVKLNSPEELKPWLMQNIGSVSVESDNCGLAEIMSEELDDWRRLYETV